MNKGKFYFGMVIRILPAANWQDDSLPLSWMTRNPTGSPTFLKVAQHL